MRILADRRYAECCLSSAQTFAYRLHSQTDIVCKDAVNSFVIESTSGTGNTADTHTNTLILKYSDNIPEC